MSCFLNSLAAKTPKLLKFSFDHDKRLTLLIFTFISGANLGQQVSKFLVYTRRKQPVLRDHIYFRVEILISSEA